MNRVFQRGSWVVTLPMACAAIVYLAFLFLPRMKAIGAVMEQLHTKQNYIAQAVKMRPMLHRIEVELAEATAYNAQWQARCPRSSELSALFGRISQLAKQQGTTVTRFEPLPAVEYQTLHRVPVTLGVKGSFAAIDSLIASVEGLPISIWIEDVKLTAPREPGQSAMCEMSLAVFVDNREKSD